MLGRIGRPCLLLLALLGFTAGCSKQSPSPPPPADPNAALPDPGPAPKNVKKMHRPIK
jgi:hypothetical protein